MKAIKILGPRKAKVSAKVSKPDLPDDCIMIKTMAVSINPTDWKHVDFISTKGATAGCDYSGVVEELGALVDSNLIKVGDRVAGYTHGCNGENLSDGSFAEYIAAKAHINFKLPDSMSFEEGCTLAVGLTTVGQGLYQNLKLPLPSPLHADSDTTAATRLETNGTQQYILIYGGSTATGTLAIQFAKMSGYTVITTCSPHNLPLARERGADHVLDYHDADCAAAIRDLTGDALALAFDCITTSESIAICCGALSSRPEVAGKSYCGVFTVGKLPRADVRSGFAMAYTALGNSFQKWDNYYPESIEDALFAGDFLRLSSALLAEGRVIVHPTRICQGGLKGVLEGMDLMRKGEVTGVKLVYPLV